MKLIAILLIMAGSMLAQKVTEVCVRVDGNIGAGACIDISAIRPALKLVADQAVTPAVAEVKDADGNVTTPASPAVPRYPSVPALVKDVLKRNLFSMAASVDPDAAGTAIQKAKATRAAVIAQAEADYAKTLASLNPVEK